MLSLIMIKLLLPQAQIFGCLLTEAWWRSLPMGLAPETHRDRRCRCGEWAGWAAVPGWAGSGSLLSAPQCTHSITQCSILTQGHHASKLLIVGAFNSRLWWRVLTYVISVPMALLLYVCNSVSLVFNHLQSGALCQLLEMARGQQKIQSQQKAAEKAAKLKKAVRQKGPKMDWTVLRLSCTSHIDILLTLCSNYIYSQHR